MKKFYVSFFLVFVSHAVHTQYNLISNYTIESVNNFTIVDNSGTLVFDNTIDHTENSGGSLKFTNQVANGTDNFKADQIPATEMAKSGAGVYLLKFYVKGPVHSRVKAAIAQNDPTSTSTNHFYWAEFRTNLANSDKNITRIIADDTWQEVNSYFVLSEEWATLKLYNSSTSTGRDIYFDDISLTKVNYPKELVSNNSFNTNGSGWSTTFVGEYTTNEDHTNLLGSGSYKLDPDDTNSTGDHIKFSATSPNNFGGAGEYKLTFWVKSKTGEKIKAQVAHKNSSGQNSTTQCTFTENLWNNDPDFTRVNQDDTWQKVTSTFSMPDSSYATVKLFSVKSESGTTITYFDDISLHRVVSSEQASTDFTGWEAVNATSSINSTIHSLNMDNGNPTLTNFDKYIDTSITKFIKVSLKNNSENDGLSFIYTKWDGSLKYLTIPIDPGSTNGNYQEYTFDLSDDLEFVGNIENFSLRVRKSNSSGGYDVVTQTGSVDFQTITYSPTASIKDIDAKSFYIYPNPASKIIYVESEIDNEIISIYDLTGRELIQSKAKFIDISQLSNGVYILELDKGVQKFIKK